MHARVTTLQADPSRVDEMADNLRKDDIPGFEKLDGFKGMTVITDRNSGKTMALTFWESEEAMRSSEDAVKSARERAASTGGSQEPQVERFEVIIDTMA